MSSSTGTSSQVLSLPKGGGAIQGIGETFQPNLFSGTGNFTVPIATTPGRAGFGPQLSLQYSTGSGNSPFGLGWELSIPRITRKTEKGLPRYSEQDVFVMSGAEDLVPTLKLDGDRWTPDTRILEAEDGTYIIRRYRPRTEGGFVRIEQWEKTTGANAGNIYWQATTKRTFSRLINTENNIVGRPHPGSAKYALGSASA